MSITVADVKTLFNTSLSDEAILPHLTRAKRDYTAVAFTDVTDELEAIGSKTIYYLSPLLWKDIQGRVNEYEESMRFSDIKGFGQYWLDRANSVEIAIDETNNQEGVFWSCTK